MVIVTEITNVFDPVNSRKTTFVDAGKPLQEYLPIYANELLVSYNGKIVQTHDIIVAEGSQIVMAPILQGGGGGGKNLLRMVAFVALAFYAPGISNFLNTTLFDGALVAGKAGMFALQASVLAAGGMLINAVLPPQMPNLNASSEKESPTYGWGGVKTLPRPGAPIPILYGAMRLPGNVIGQYIKDEGTDQYLYTHLALCEGEIENINIQNILINNNPITNYEDATYSFRPGTLTQDITGVPQLRSLNVTKQPYITWFNKVYTTIVFSSELIKDAPVIKTTSGNSVEEIEIEIALPQGLGYIKNDGSMETRTVEFKIEYRVTGSGDDTWQTYQRVVPSHIEHQYEWEDGCDWSYDDTNIWSATEPTSGGCWHKTGNERDVVIDEATYDTWEITAASRSAIRQQFLIEDLDENQYDVRLTRITDDSTDDRLINGMYWNGFNEISMTRLYYPTIAQLAIRIKATGQLSGSAPTISTFVKRKSLDIYDENGVFQFKARSDNPAWVAWDILTNKQYGAKKAYDQVNYAAFKDFADWCDEAVPDGKGGEERRASFNGVIDFQSNLWEVLQKICAVGRGAPVIQGTKFSVIVDKPTIPTQLFSMGNIIQGSYKTAYTGMQDLSNEIEISYIDKNASYTKQVVSVLLGDGGKKTSINSLGTVTQTQAYRLGRYLLQTSDKQRRIVEFDAHIDSIACNLGDVIYFSHDVPQWGHSGRVVRVTSNTITYDEEIYCETTKNYTTTIRKLNDTFASFDLDAVSADDSYTTFSFTEFAAGRVVNGGLPSDSETNAIGGSAPDTTTYTREISGGSPSDTYDGVKKYDVYSFGEVDKEYLKLRVSSISRKSTFTRHFVCLDYNESILTDTTTALPIDRPSELTGFASLTDVDIKEHLVKKGDGTIVPFIDLTWTVVDDRLSYIDLLISGDDGATWQTVVQDYKERFYSYNAISLAEGKTYKFALRTSDVTGQQPMSDAVIIDHTYLGKSEPPADVTGLGYFIEPTLGVTLYWNEVEEVDLAGYNIYIDSVLEYKKVTTTKHFVGLPTSNSVTYDVKAVDTSGNESTEADSLTVNFVPPSVGSITSVVEGDKVTIQAPNVTQGSFAIASYEFSGSDGSSVSTTDAYADFYPTTSPVTYTVIVTDVAGLSDEGSVDFTAAPPSVSELAAEVSGNRIKVKASATQGTLPIASYLFEDTTNSVSITSKNPYTFFDAQSLTTDFKVAVLDTGGFSASATTSLTLTPPTITSFNGSPDNGKAKLEVVGSAGSYAIDKYIFINTSTSQQLESASPIGYMSQTLGTTTYQVNVYDVNGFSSSTTTDVMIVTPDAPSVSFTVDSSTLTFDITGHKQTNDIAYTKVKNYFDSSVVTVKGSEYITVPPPGADYQYGFISVDSAGFESTETITTVSLTTPSTTNLGYSIEGSSVILNWQVQSAGTFAVEYFKVTHQGQTIDVHGTTYTVPANWTGSEAFTVVPVDVNGNSGSGQTINIDIEAPSAPSVSGSIDDTNLLLQWAASTGTLDIDHYVVSYDGVETSVDTLNYALPVTWQTKTFNVKAVDVARNESTDTAFTSDIILPKTTNVTYQVIDNNVILRWSYQLGSLPFETVTVKRGTDVSTAEIIGTKKGTFTVVFEAVGGTYTYWVCPKDTAGNSGQCKNVTVEVGSPPDYVLNVNWNSDLNGALTNAYHDTRSNSIFAPINVTETYQEHFDNNSWSSPQDQVDAGYPIWSEPYPTSALYEETFDYGTELASSTITVDYTLGDKIGSGVSISTDILISADNSNWTTYTNTKQVFATNFQYVKIKLNFSSTDDKSLVEIKTLTVRLDAKVIRDSGMVSASSSDSNGTWVDFNRSFVDVSSITLTPQGTSQVTAIYDFNDVPNPTGFSVYLFDSNGNRTSGTVSWQATGY